MHLLRLVAQWNSEILLKLFIQLEYGVVKVVQQYFSKQGWSRGQKCPKMCENTLKDETYSIKGYESYFSNTGGQGIKSVQKWPKMCENTRKYEKSSFPGFVAQWNL